MPQGGFDFNGEKYVVDSDTNPPSVWRISAQGPVLMTTNNPGWGGPELRQKVNATLKSITPQQQTTAATKPGVVWKADPSLSTGGTFVDSGTGQPLPVAPGQRQTNTQQQDVEWNGTEFVPKQQAAAGAAAAPASAAPTQSEIETRILGSLGRGGWTVTGRSDEQKSMSGVDADGLPTTTLKPTGNVIWSITGPGGKNTTMTVHPKADTPGDFDVVEPPKDLPAGADKTFAVKGMGTYYYDPLDPTTPPKLLVPEGAPNADEEITKAVDRQDRERLRNEKQANEAAGRGYQTNADYQVMASNAARDRLGQDQLAENIRQFNAKQGQEQKQFDAKQKTDDAVAAQNILQSKAQVGSIEAGTAKTTQDVAFAAQDQPGKLAQAAATLAGTQASTAATRQSTQIAGAPQLQPGLTSPVLTRVNPLTGDIDQSQANLAFQPKTMADVAARAGQIKSAMDAKSAEVQGKVGQTVDGKLYTADDALRDYNAWHTSKVAPHLDELKQAQDDALLQRTKDEQGMRVAAQTAAQNAGTLNVNAFNAMAGANPIGPGFEAANRAASKGDFGALSGVENATTWQGPNPMESSQAAVMQALKYIDPRAAAATGAPQPNYQGLDIQALLGSKPYTSPGVPAPPAPPAPAPVAAAPAWNPADIQWNQPAQNEPGRTMGPGGAVTPQMPGWLTGQGPPPPNVTPPNVVPGSNYGSTGVPSWLATPEDIIRAQGNYWPPYSFAG